MLLMGCTTTGLLGDFNLISPQQEMRLGEELHQDIAQQNLVTDPGINGYVQEIGKRLISVSLTPSQPYSFYVLKDDQVNAFAIPGGKLYVYTGLISRAESEAELASVMAHELGHAEERHPTEAMSRQMGTQVLTGILLGENPGAASRLAAGLLANGGLSAYSRGAELEADRIACYLLNRSGYDPAALITFFQKLMEEERKHGGGGRSLFATHPPTQERINAAAQLIQSFGDARQYGKEVVGGFEALQQQVRGL